MLALVQATCLVDANSTGEAGSFRKLLQLRKQLALAIGGAGSSRCTFRADIMTNKNVAFKRSQS